MENENLIWHEYQSQFYFDKGLKIKVSLDFLHYYLWLTRKATWNTIKIVPPKYNAHISVTLPHIHGWDKVNKSSKYAGRNVAFRYTGDVIEGGSWFRNFWMPVECPKAERIKEKLGIVEKNFLGFHLTLGSTKAEANEKKEFRELTERFNRGEFSVDKYRQMMIDLKNKI